MHIVAGETASRASIAAPAPKRAKGGQGKSPARVASDRRSEEKQEKEGASFHVSIANKQSIEVVNKRIDVIFHR